MIELKKVHERETFDLIAQRTLSWSSVEPLFTAMGFVLMDDFASLKRSDKIEPWQSETLATCDFLAAGKEVYPDENDFDSIRFSILVATLPKDQVMKALHILYSLADQLRVDVMFAARPVPRVDADALAEKWLSEILAETGDVCGSESVRILVEMEYEKRRA